MNAKSQTKVIQQAIAHWLFTTAHSISTASWLFGGLTLNEGGTEFKWEGWAPLPPPAGEAMVGAILASCIGLHLTSLRPACKSKSLLLGVDKWFLQGENCDNNWEMMAGTTKRLVSYIFAMPILQLKTSHFYCRKFRNLLNEGITLNSCHKCSYNLRKNVIVGACFSFLFI